ncbi:Verru_Chthon cassette protein B [Prosthecobacter sp.]|uniref:Verru_Chthon cassette protein B n=1 Tax=Prosthecobacter sp. TaxID=1965333 RepID=UPI002ABB282C|nr:Verru_Chthon cassette protein B [Prosthecobacter sp.]MDZ4403379.1 Verru_Chthon cassette protein B [Prosthecobacter sp.]
MKFQKNIASSRRGFSLVEVTLAVAIAALAIITFLGLLPQGLEVSRKTAQMAAHSNILEQIVRDLENARWDKMPTGNDERKFFNDQGVEVDSESTEITLVAQMDYSLPAALPKTESSQKFLRRVVVKIANTSSTEFDFDPEKKFTYATYNHLVAKTRASTSISK